MKVGMIGPYPPPRGGVSVHTQRLEEFLLDRGVMVEILTPNFGKNANKTLKSKLIRIKWVLWVLTTSKSDILHIHGGIWWEFILIIWVAKIRQMKTVMTFHSLRQDFDQMNLLEKSCWSYTVKNVDYLIITGENERNKLVKYFNRKERLSVLPAFIPPKRVEIALPERLEAFLQNHSLIISANASNLDFYGGQDLYGLDMLVELCSRLNSEINVGFVYCLSRISNERYLEEIQTRIQELRIENLFLIIPDSSEFWPVLERSHIFIRPTCTDSYGVSIAEALTFGIPSIASDVCKRPEGTILFHSRDSEELYRKVREIITNYDLYKAQVQQLEYENCAHAILRIYQQLTD